MKKMTRIWVVCLLALSTMAFAVVKNVFDQLEMAEDEAREYIFGNFKEGNLSFPHSSVLKGLASGKRAGVVKELSDYIRKYCSSPDFLQAYKEARESAKPAAPADKAAKVKARLEEIKNDIASNEEGMKGAVGDMKKLYEATIKMLKAEQKALQDPKDPQHGMYMSNLTEGNDMDTSQYAEAVAAFEKEYPANVQVLIKRRLQEFLALTADMDFDAKLIDKGGRKRFADPKLEAKDETWKRCFRCGRETITAARTFAQQWLAELK
ncbi:MAG: hypothetical protein J7621_00595 [Niastella sp.]|nr:hypothetical protein [Niastella sp.]